MENIQPAEWQNVEPAADIVTAVIPGLIMSDKRAGDGISEVARDMRTIAAPMHPGRDPVSVHIVDELVAVLRGDGGLAPQLAAVLDRLESSADRLAASRRRHEVTDHDTADTIRRILDAHQP